MNYSLTSLPKSEAEISVILPFSEFEPHVKRAAVLISEETEIEGFRKGKAPYEVVKQRVGEVAIYERAAELAVHKTYPRALEALFANGQLSDDSLPIGRPSIAVMKLAPGNELEYKAKLSLLSRVILPQYLEIAKRALEEKKEIVVGEEEVEKALDWLRESRVTLFTVDRPAALQDRVEVDLEIRHGGVRIDGGDSKNHPLVIGRGKFLPGFEDQLIGMKTGETKQFTLAVPDDWRDKQYAGKALDITAIMRLVQERRVPELGDEFAKQLGKFESVEQLRSNVREGIAEEKRIKERDRMRIKMIEAIAKEAAMEIPDLLVERELEKMIEESRRSIEEMGMKWEDYCAHLKKTAEDFRKEWRDGAQQRVRIALALREIARQERLQPSEEEIKVIADRTLQQYRSAGEAERAIDPEALQEYSRGIVRNEKVFELLERLGEPLAQ